MNLPTLLFVFKIVLVILCTLNLHINFKINLSISAKKNKDGILIEILLNPYSVQRVKVKVKSLSRVRLFATPWSVAHQAPLSMGFSRQEDQSGLPFPSPEDLPYLGIKPGSPTLQADALTSEPPGKPSLEGITMLII